MTAAATSTDPTYNGVNAADVAVTNTDNDVAGITVTPTAGLTTTEAGGTATFTVVLNTQPTADVTIALTLERHDGRHGRPGEPDLYDRELERGADGDGDRRRRRRRSTATSAYTIVTAAATSTRPELQRRRMPPTWR